MLTLTAAGAADPGSTGSSGAATGSTPAAGSTAAAAAQSSGSGGGSDTAGIVLGALGLAAGLAALVLNLLSRRRSES